MSTPTPSNGRPVLTASEAYTLWAPTYDSDGNPLQALDSIALREMLPRFLNHAGSYNAVRGSKLAPRRPLFIDLGCGTGRGTLALLESAYGKGASADFGRCAVEVLCLDLSKEMLDRAETKVNSYLASQSGTEEHNRPHVEYQVFDMLASTRCTDGAAGRPALPWGQATGVVSTLVAEHVPDLAVFFETCATLLAPDGVLMATNMHPDMGKESGAGFTDARGLGERKAGGAKVRVEGYAHSAEDFCNAAAAAGFTTVHDGEQAVIERGIEEWMVAQNVEQLARRGSKWLGKKVWMGGLWRKMPGRS